MDERTGKLFSGDHILDPITPHVGIWFDFRGDPLGTYAESVRKVEARGATGVLPAHGEPPNIRRTRTETDDEPSAPCMASVWSVTGTGSIGTAICAETYFRTEPASTVAAPSSVRERGPLGRAEIIRRVSAHRRGRLHALYSPAL